MTRKTDSGADVRAGYRGDIEGLRAVAVGLVLLADAGVTFLPGGFVGVDVFFVVSGFLITGILVDEFRRTGTVSVLGFYARRAKRLLPAVGVVLIATLLLTVLLLPRTRWATTGWDVVASGLYVMNWRLAHQAGDYLAAGEAASMLQHFWSLAVEEQFYLVWPLVLIVLSWRSAARRRAGRRRRATRPARGWQARLFVVSLLIGVPSFAWAVQLTGTDPARAYFVTSTRMWELAAGCALAVVGRQLHRLPRVIAVGLGWAGLGAIGSAAVLIPSTAAFAGTMALLPVLGTVAVLAAGPAAGRAGPVALLGLRPMRVVGAVSYSLYLWHWPLLIVAESRFGQLNMVAGLAVVALSVVPAVLSYRYVEEPIRRGRGFAWEPLRAIRLGVACTVLPAAAGFLFQLVVLPPHDPSPSTLVLPPFASGAAAPTTGAAVLGATPRGSRAGAPVDRVDRITPDPLTARDDLPDVYRDGCFAEGPDSTVRTCVYGDRGSAYTVALVGDSHAGNWIPALQAIAAEKKWRLVTYLKQACPFVDVPISVSGQPQPSCTTWNDRVAAALTGPDRPDLLLTTSFLYVPTRDDKPLTGGPAITDALVDGMRRRWSAMTSAGVPTVVVRDTPQLNVRVADCVAANPEKLTRCSVPRDIALTATAGPAQERAARDLPNVPLIDLNDAICPADRCAAVIGGVLVYRDTNHLTASYAYTLAPRLRAELDRVLS